MIKLHMYPKLEQGRVDFWIITKKHNLKITIALPLWAW